MFGLGGAGCNVLERLREKGLLRREVITVTVNASGAGRAADLLLPRSADGTLDGRVAVKAVAASHAHVVFVAALGGDTGLRLLHSLCDRFAGTRMVSVVAIAPFDFERSKSLSLPSLARAPAVKVIHVDNARLAADLPATITWRDCLDFINTRACAMVADATSRQMHLTRRGT